jgi:hypothetical protein
VNGTPKQADRALFWHRQAPDHVVNTDSAECHRDRSFGFGQHRSDDLADQGRAVWQCIGVFDGNGGAQDIVGRNASALPAEFVATVRPANPFQDAVTDQSLKHRLKMPWRKLVPGRQCLRRNRAGPRIDADVYYSSNGEEALARYQRGTTQVTPDNSGIRLRPKMRIAANGGGC